MVQDTSLPSEMYLSKLRNGTCGGWGIYDTDEVAGSSSREVDYTNLRECDVLWATSVPTESEWCAGELDGNQHSTWILSLSVNTIAVAMLSEREQSNIPTSSSSSARPHKFPHPGVEHIGVQVKVFTVRLSCPCPLFHHTFQELL